MTSQTHLCSFDMRKKEKIVEKNEATEKMKILSRINSTEGKIPPCPPSTFKNRFLENLCKVFFFSGFCLKANMALSKNFYVPLKHARKKEENSCREE